MDDRPPFSLKKCVKFLWRLWINSAGAFFGMGDTASQLFGIELGAWRGRQR